MARGVGAHSREFAQAMAESRPSIFISCHAADFAWRDLIVEGLLRSESVEPWVDTRIQVGDEWDKSLKRRIAESSAIVLVLSPEYLKSRRAEELAVAVGEADSDHRPHVTWVLASDCEVSDTAAVEGSPAHDPRRPLETLVGEQLKRIVARICRHVVGLVAPARDRMFIDTASRDLGMQWREFVELTVAVMDRMGGPALLAPTRELLPVPDQDALRRAGFDVEPRALGMEDPRAMVAAEHAALLGSALSTEEVAERLGVQPSRIRQRLNSDPPTLYGVRGSSREWLVPSFQFNEQGVIPGLGKVIAALDPELHPVSVYRWFHAPNPDLVDEELMGEEPLSPLDWLAAGQDPELVVELARNL